jgi:hypothetical protein
MALLEKCIAALRPDAKIYESQQGELLHKNFQDDIKFTEWGRIDWSGYPQRIQITSLSLLQISDELNFLKDPFLIFWDEASLPVIESPIQNIINAVDDVTAVSYDTWVYHPERKIIIEFFHEGDITLLPG